MRIKKYKEYGIVSIWASANDTYNWAHKPGASWPCSQLSGNRFYAQFQHGDLVEFTLNGKDGDIDSTEFNAFIQDHLGSINLE